MTQLKVIGEDRLTLRWSRPFKSYLQNPKIVYGGSTKPLALLEYLPPLRRTIFWLWAIAVGTSESRGIVQALRYLPKEKSLAFQKLWLSWQGRWQGWQTWQKNK